MIEVCGVNDLVNKYNRTHPHGHYFDRDTLKFFGESLSTMRVLKGTVMIEDICGKTHECYTLSKFQKKHPLGPRRSYAYFDVNTLDDVII